MICGAWCRGEYTAIAVLCLDLVIFSHFCRVRETFHVALFLAETSRILKRSGKAEVVSNMNQSTE